MRMPSVQENSTNCLTPLAALRSAHSFDAFYPAVRRSLLAGQGVLSRALGEWGLRFAKRSLLQRAQHVRRLTDAMRDAIGAYDCDVVEHAYHAVSCAILPEHIMEPTLNKQQLELFMALGALAELSPSVMVQSVWAQHTYYHRLHEDYAKHDKEENYNEVAKTVLSSDLADAMKLRFLNAPLRAPIWMEPENVGLIRGLLESQPASDRWASLPLRRGASVSNVRMNRTLMQHYVPEMLPILDALGVDDSIALVSPVGETTPYFKHIRMAAQAMNSPKQPIELALPNGSDAYGEGFNRWPRI